MYSTDYECNIYVIAFRTVYKNINILIKYYILT